MKVNLKMLSESLGLSQTTVSRALNGYSDVSEATRQRVVEAATKLGYQPNPQARQLATGRADAIGIVYPFGASDIGDIRFGEVVSGLTEQLAKHRIDLLIHSSRPEVELDTYRRLIDGRRVDALIVARTRLDDPRIRFLQERNFPFVAYGRTETPLPYAWFDFDNEAGGRMAAQRLLDLGHRRIALIHAPLELSFAAQRHAGFVAALREAGIEPDPELIIEAPLNRIGGYQAVGELLAMKKPPTALLVDNNVAGVGALRALGDNGWKPGSGMSLIVYDGIPSEIPLTCTVTGVLQPTGESTGRALADLVLDVLAGKPLEDLHRLGQPCIGAGETDGPPPAPTRHARTKTPC
ncbi:substrate-binding domain-containing protein [Aromatoleum petrolei]|uniref:LacI family DNA-binding transcriptional regulator n=1 Tax=Aromatoleum petrolei TaxID=76116 RepID=A0ABX1MH56_9RHOO|nr:substrate-binding domain-containing protein [Aromatoleum petrolei]NMF87260.1 LacI family DNA-binding transcriptional regulator [Aromatoleum petrolei]QTQ38504.1 Transcriptional regulator, LacI family [Aromatoleum petrolei]